MSARTITVKQEVEAILRVQVATYAGGSQVLPPETAEFYRDVAEVLQDILDEYTRPEPDLETPTFKVGDHVLLTGPLWDYSGFRGTIVTITEGTTENDNPGDAHFEHYNDEWIVEANPDSLWGGKVVDPEIHVGDTARITQAYRDTITGVGLNKVGTEFVVTRRIESVHSGIGGTFYVAGDPAGRGIWDVFIEKVHA